MEIDLFVLEKDVKYLEISIWNFKYYQFVKIILKWFKNENGR